MAGLRHAIWKGRVQGDLYEILTVMGRNYSNVPGASASSLLAFCSMVLLACGCMTFNKLLIGMNRYKTTATIQEQVHEAKKNKIYDECFILDTNYRNTWNEVMGGSYDLQKELIQPLQVRIYDKRGVLVQIVANCDAGGLPNLRWEDTHVFDSMPLKKNRMIDSTIMLINDIKYMTDLKTGEPARIEPRKEHTILVYWTFVMGRQSRRLIDLARESRLKHMDDYDLYFVVADNLYEGWASSASDARKDR